MTPCKFPVQKYQRGNFRCLLSVHVGDLTGIAPRHVTDSLLAHLNDTVGQCKADCGHFLHTGIQHEHSPRVVFTHLCVYVGNITVIEHSLLVGKDEEALFDAI